MDVICKLPDQFQISDGFMNGLVSADQVSDFFCKKKTEWIFVKSNGFFRS